MSEWVKLIKSKTTYSESESKSDFSFAINSASDFESGYESASESDFNSVFINLDICLFFALYLLTLF